ncbi:MAG: hypothetical protein IPO78_09960 [Saprospiraceae bacterium]|nr:hypothetical protein [Saprospiraceae bacterium]
MELIKEGRFEFYLLIEDIKHPLDWSNVNGCCPYTKAVLAGLKFVSSDPQDLSFFINCFGNPHELTEFGHNLSGQNYDSESHKQKIFLQARLLHGKLRAYFLEAILKHVLWVNENDHWTNCKFEFERILLPELKIMLLELDIRTASINASSKQLKLNNEEEGENDIVLSTIEDYLFEFRDENILNESEYIKLVLALNTYFKSGKFPEITQMISVSRVNKKRFGWALNEIYRKLKTQNENLSSDYLQFAHNHISIFKDVQFDTEDILSSNLYKYFTTKTQ